MTSKKANEFSTYGSYSVKESLVLLYPETEIKIQRTEPCIFTYFRKNSEGQTTEKLIHNPSETLDLEVCPILPMNLPARKTNDLLFLRFENQVYVSKNSTIDIFVPFPIEIGVFVANNGKPDSSFIDCFTCEPLHSRFGLYGTPNDGDLCMYARVPIQKNLEPFIYALTKISIKNGTDRGVLVGKVVFPVSEHNMYYVDKTSDAHIDDLAMTIEDDSGKNTAMVTRIKHKENENWVASPHVGTKEGRGRFLMNRGID